MIPLEIENEFKTILNAFKRVGKGIYKNEKQAMQKIYSTTEILFKNNVQQNPLLIKCFYLLIYHYTIFYKDPKQAVFMLSKNLEISENLMIFKLKDVINSLELDDLFDALESGVINIEQKEAIHKNINKWSDEHIQKSVYTTINELIFNERTNEL